MINTGPAPSDLDVADVTGDGLRDVVVGTDAGIQIFRNDGNRGFSLLRTIRWIGPIGTVAADDLDADGDVDIVASIPVIGELSVYWNASGGDFGHGVQRLVVGGNPSYVKVADLDQDGKLDLVTNDPSTKSAVVVIAGLGDHAFAAPEPLPNGFTPLAFAIGVMCEALFPRGTWSAQGAAAASKFRPRAGGPSRRAAPRAGEPSASPRARGSSPGATRSRSSAAGGPWRPCA